jgi:hypothetical protein
MNLKEYLRGRKDKSSNSEINNLLAIPIKDKKGEVASLNKNVFSEGYYQQSDLLYLPKDKGFQYLLVVVDVYNSKFDCEPLKIRTSAAVQKAFVKIYARKFIEFPMIMCCDQGSEFKGIVKDYFTIKGCYVKYALTSRHAQQAYVEAKNRQLGDLIMSYQSLKELETHKIYRKWVDDLDTYKNEINDNIKERKVKIEGNILYGKDNIMYELHDKVRRILDFAKSSANNKRLTGAFRKGDIRWDKPIHEITQIFLNPNSPPLYQLDNSYKVAYTKKQLQPVDNNEKKIIKR